MTGQAPHRPPSEATDMALYAVAGGVALLGVLWLAGAASARLSGHRAGICPSRSRRSKPQVSRT